MPALPSVPKVVRVALAGAISPAHQWVSRFYISYTGTAPTIAQLNTFSTSVSTAWGTNLKALQSTHDDLTRVDSVDLSSPTSAVGFDTTVIGGTRAGDELPPQICLVASYKVNRRYRGGHARGYFPFGVATDVVDDVWAGGFTGPALTDLNNFFAAVIAAPWAAAGTLAHVNVSYFQGFTVVISPTTGRARNVPTVRAVPVVDPVASVVVQPSIGTQRRREGFVD